MTDLTARLGPLTLPNPVLSAAGCAGAGPELHRFADLAALGAFVTASVGALPRAGAATPRMAETPSGMLHATGLPGPGIDALLAQELPWLAEQGVRTIVSIAGRHSDEFVAVAHRLAGHPAVAALEVNISTPERGQLLAADAVASARVVGAVRRAADPAQPVFVKLSADVTDIGHVARVCADAGVDGFTLVNAVSGLVIDTDTLAPALADVTGGLSGPAIRPIALRCVWQVHRTVSHLPIIGSGGVTSGLDALQFVLAGASAVAVGVAAFGDPAAPQRILAELDTALSERGFDRLSQAVGAAHRAPQHAPRRALAR